MLPDSFGVGSNGFVNFFFQAPPTLTPGTTYYLQPVVQFGDTLGASSYNYGYQDGTAFFGGLPSPISDLWFREGVVTPEPSSTMLVLLGGPLLAYSFRRSRNTDPSPQACETKAAS
jgi:hypothetical protein